MVNLSIVKRKELGLPIWAWAAVVAVVIFGGFFILRRRGGMGSGNSAQTSEADTAPQNIPGGGGGGFSPFEGETYIPDYFYQDSTPSVIAQTTQAQTGDNSTGISDLSSQSPIAAAKQNSILQTSPLFNLLTEEGYTGFTSPPPVYQVSGGGRSNEQLGEYLKDITIPVQFSSGAPADKPSNAIKTFYSEPPVVDKKTKAVTTPAKKLTNSGAISGYAQSSGSNLH